MRDDLLSTWGKEKAEMIDAFGRTRDSFMKSDQLKWLELNSIYPHVEEVLTTASLSNCFIITTKQERFVRAILEHKGLLSFLGDESQGSHIFDLENPYGGKAAVLLELLRRDSTGKRNIHFFEDRCETLLNIKHLIEEKLPRHTSNRIKLYLVDWGYNTIQQRKLAKAANIPVLTVQDFKQMFHV